MVKAKKHFGQNFLRDEGVLKDILKASELKESDHIVEIGPGEGFLTEGLVKTGAKVMAVELDRDLIPFLKIQFKNAKNFELFHGDALKFIPPKEPYKLIANIPYYITSPILNHFLMEQFTGGNPPNLLVLMVQKEVAEKILAQKNKHSVLSLQVHLFGEPELVRWVAKTAFKPMPQVDSAVLKIRTRETPKINGDLKKIFWLFHVSFAQKRKKLSNNLVAALQKSPAKVREILVSAKINADIRAEDLSFEEWQRLFNALN